MPNGNFNSKRGKYQRKTPRVLVGVSNTPQPRRLDRSAVKFRVHITIYKLADGAMSSEITCTDRGNRALSWEDGKLALECTEYAIEQALEFQRHRLRLLDKGLDLFGRKFYALNPLGEREE